MTISLAGIQCHALFFVFFSTLRAKWQPLTCERKEEKTHMCWAEEQRGEEASEESTGDGCLTGCGNTPFHSLVWQKNKHRATKLLLSPALMDKRWFFFFFLFLANKTRRPSGKRRWRLTNGRPPPEPDTVVLRVSGPLGRVSHSSAPFWVLNHLILPVSWLPQCGLMGGPEPLLRHLLCIFTHFCTHLGSCRIIPVYNI